MLWAKGLLYSSCPTNACWVGDGSCPQAYCSWGGIGCRSNLAASRRTGSLIWPSSFQHWTLWSAAGWGPGVNRLTVIIMARGGGAGKKWRGYRTTQRPGNGLRQWIWPPQTGVHWHEGSFIHSFIDAFMHSCIQWIFLCSVPGCRETLCGIKWRRRTVWCVNLK